MSWEFVRRLYILLSIAFPGAVVTQPHFWALLLSMALSTGYAYVNTLKSTYEGLFIESVIAADGQKTVEHGLVGVGILLSNLVHLVLVDALNGYAVICIRRNISCFLQHGYLRARIYYHLNNQKRADNPDVRITSDTIAFSKLLVEVFIAGWRAMSYLVIYTVVLAEIHWFIVVVAWAFFITMLIPVRLLMSAISELLYRQERKEGAFRYGHIRLRTYAESVAFLDGDSCERTSLEGALDRCVLNSKNTVIKNLYLNFCLTTISYVCNYSQYIFFAFFLLTGLSTVPPIVFPEGMTVAERSGKMTTIGSLITAYVLLGYSALVGDNSNGLSKQLADMNGYCARIGELMEVYIDLEKEDNEYRELLSKQPEILLSDDELVRVQDLSAYTPQGELLYENLTFSIHSGRSVLVMGPSGCGKSSLLRLIGGIWRLKPEKGQIVKPQVIGRNGIFYLPQRSYMFLGKLRDQITYPSSSGDDPNYSAKERSDKELQRLLAKVNLSYIFTRYGDLDTECDWSTVLSLGEQQRLGMARLLYHKPVFAVLDESTSAVDQQMEAKFYALCKAANITFISVAHRHSVKKYHDVLIRFDRQKNFVIEDMPHESNSGNTVASVETSVSSNSVLQGDEPETPLSQTSGSTTHLLSEFASAVAPARVDSVSRQIDVEDYEEPGLDEEEIDRGAELEDDQKIDAPASKAKLDLMFFRRLIRITKLFLINWRSKGTLMLYAIVFCQLCVTGLIFGVNTLSGGLSSALSEVNTGLVFYNGGIIIAVVILQFIFENANMYFIGMATVEWRRNLASYIQSRYFRNKNYYKSQITRNSVDNSDVRITQDIIDFFLNLGPILFVTTPAVLRMLMGAVFLAMYSWILLVGVLALYIISVVVIQLAMSQVGKWTYKLQALEGNLRFSIARIRTFAESVGFLAGERQERLLLDHKLGICINTAKGLLVRASFFLNPALQATNVLASLMGFWVLALHRYVPFFSIGWETMSDADIYGMIIVTFGYGVLLIANLLVLSNTLKNFSSMIGFCTRIAELIEALDEADKQIDAPALMKSVSKVESEPQTEPTSPSNIKMELSTISVESAAPNLIFEEDELMKLDNVSCITPADQTLFSGLSLSIQRNKNVIIMGPSGCGKSSLLRLIGGLWLVREGRIVRSPALQPLHKDRPDLSVFFLPQKSYMFNGTLLEQVIYPLTAESTEVRTEDIEAIFELVNLKYLFVRNNSDWNTLADWSAVLSLGEQQRLAMARLFFHKPSLAVLDESTSAVDYDVETVFYEEMRNRGITFISVAHNQSVVRFHDMLLKFEKQGDSLQYTYSPLARR